MNTKLLNFQDKLEYKFNDINLLNTALTHSSFANENKKSQISNNERLEFLGDSVLNLIVSNYVFVNYSNMPEGELTKIRASVVCETTLKDVAIQLDIGKHIRLGKGEELTGGRNRPSILSDAFEAIVGAIYIDGGFENAEAFVLKWLLELIKNSVHGEGMLDYKTILQEKLQKNGDVRITYQVINETGPDHDKKFSIQVKYDGKVLGLGQGKSKKEAEQLAARKALKLVEGS